MTQPALLLVFSLLSLIAGAGLTWLAMRNSASLSAAKARAEAGTELAVVQTQLRERATRIETLEKSLEVEQQARIAAENNAAALVARLEGLNQQFQAKEQQFAEKVAFVEEARVQLADQFKNLANEILEEKGKRFAEQNQTSLGSLLNPLREKLVEFQTKVEDVYVKEGKDRSALAEQVRQLMGLNQELSEDARNLTSALKGDNKAQGNWGELVLTRVLEASGLREGHEYRPQASHTQEDGRRLQPDVVVDLPRGRSLVIDSKMSLTAYEAYVSADGDQERDTALKNHISSVRGHIRNLQGKQYQSMYQLQTLDFVLMFVPVEPAFMAAVNHGENLFKEAWDSGVLLVSPSTLVFVLRTVEYLWRQESHNRNAQEIAKRGGELYDRLCDFAKELETVGDRLKQAQTSFDNARNKLAHNRGSVIRQVEMLRKLGLKPKKSLPASFTPNQDEEDSDGESANIDTQNLLEAAETEADTVGADQRRPRTPRADSNLARAKELVRNHIEGNEPATIKSMIVEQLGLSPNVANTYYYQIRKQLLVESNHQGE